MIIRPIRTEQDHESAVRRIEELMSAKPGSSEFDELEVLSTLVEAYEREHHRIDPPDPIEAIKFRMDQGQLTRADLTTALGGRSRATEVLKGRRQLSKAMIVRLHVRFGIPLASLLGDQLAKAHPRQRPTVRRANPGGGRGQGSRARKGS